MGAAESLSLRRYGASPGSHSHNHFQILLGLSGALDLEVAGHGVRVAPGGGCVIAPGDRHDFESSRGSVCLVLATNPCIAVPLLLAAPVLSGLVAWKIRRMRPQFELMQKRIDKQPLDKPSAGSTFKRPAGAFAAALIDQCGLRGYRHGGAAVSDKHCGFVVNLGGATCADVLALCDEVRAIVKEKTGYDLEKEIRVVK